MRHYWARIACLLLVLAPGLCRAQYEQSTWCFGERCNYWFPPDGSMPYSIIVTAMKEFEGSASISDRRFGWLLYYTDGQTLWNAANVPTKNGTGLKGHWSSTQSALFVPMPEDPDKYYLFTSDTGPYEDPPNNGIFYNVLDLARGDLTEKNVPLVAQATEKLTAVRHCNGIDYWVIAHGWGDDRFYAYRITPSGIDPPVISSTGIAHDTTVGSNAIGYLKSSPDGRALACAIHGKSIVEIFDFDKETGRISAPVDIPIRGLPYGVSFSPAGRLLYVTVQDTTFNSRLLQYDLSTRDSATIARSMVKIDEHSGLFGALQLAPNGKIYMSILNAHDLASIGCPDNRGSACCFLEDDPGAATGGTCQLGLPNMIDDTSGTAMACNRPVARFTVSADTICQDDSIDVIDSSLHAVTWYWQIENGLPSNAVTRHPGGIRFIRPGRWSVMLVVTNDGGTDTARVQVQVETRPVADAGPDQSICPGGSVRLAASGGGGYRWSPPDGLSCVDCAAPSAAPSKTTVYHLLVTGAGGCTAADSITVTVRDSLSIEAGKDATICPGDSVRLAASGADDYRWSPATGLDCIDCASPVARPMSTTTYLVRGTRGTCTGVDSITITVRKPPTSVDAGNDTTICADGIARLHVSASGAVRFAWAPEEGLSCTECVDPVARPTRTTAYFVTAFSEDGCSAGDTVVVAVAARLAISIAPVEPVCTGDSVTLIASVPKGSSMHWTPRGAALCPDCATTRALPPGSTTFYLDVITPEGCAARDSVFVPVLPPPVVDAGPDLTICTGDSVRLNATGGVDFRWEPADGLDCTTCPSPVAAPRSTTTYHVAVTTADGCRGTDSVTVYVSHPSIGISPGATICAGDTTTLRASGGISYRWSPSSSVACDTCAVTLANPTETTRYRLHYVDTSGCSGIDSTLVIVDDPLRLTIPPDLHARPGGTVMLPVLLNDPVGSAAVSSLHIRLFLPPTLRPTGVARTGSVTQGWTIELDPAPDGVTELYLTAPPGRRLSVPGPLALVEVAVYLDTTLERYLPFSADVPGMNCPPITWPGHVTFDSICGLSDRLIVLSPAKYAMLGVRPNPFNPSARISFSLGLDGQTSVSVVDAAGHLVATLLEEYLEPGEHSVTWDATQYPSGLYFYRIESGAWHAGGALLLVK